MTPHLQATLPAYAPHDLSQTLLYRVVADHLETFIASLDTDPCLLYTSDAADE